MTRAWAGEYLPDALLGSRIPGGTSMHLAKLVCFLDDVFFLLDIFNELGA